MPHGTLISSAKKIDEFRSWKDKSQQSRTNKQKRLEAAINRPVGRFPLKLQRTTLFMPALVGARSSVNGKKDMAIKVMHCPRSGSANSRGEIAGPPSRSKFSVLLACNARFRRTLATPWFYRRWLPYGGTSGSVSGGIDHGTAFANQHHR